MAYDKPLPKKLGRFRPIIADFSDETEIGNGYLVYLIQGLKSPLDPVGNEHQIHEDTIGECAMWLNSVNVCDCDECWAKHELGTVKKVRISKGVRPFGGRAYPVLEWKNYPSGRRTVIVNVGNRAQMSVYVADQREYNVREVEVRL